MRAFALFLLAIIALVNGTKIVDSDYHTFVNRQAIAEEVNAMKTTWKAAVHSRFSNATVADVKMLLGTILVGEEGYEEPEFVRTTFPVSVSALPASFDVRTHWPECSAVTSRVRDQSNCGSCWAFSSTESFNDRRCIAGKGTEILSSEDTAACCSGAACSGSMGCNGGQPAGAWKWFTKTGVSTGLDWADVGKGSSCKPYSMQSCAHHTEPPAGMVSCTTLPSYKTPKCTSTCSESNYVTAYLQDKKKAGTSYSIKAANLQQELYEKGSISVAFTVYEDFETYSSGIYQHVSGKSLGGHAVKLIGWGEENGTPYWTIMNSWNDSWGEKGTFRIIRGKNECGIESQGVAGDA